MNVLIINGPNLNMLGIREPGIYGNENYESLVNLITNYCNEKNIECDCFQSNHEGAIIDKIQEGYGKVDGIVINAGAYTHYSYAIFDAMNSVKIPSVEVHISDIHQRESFRHISVIQPACFKQICGHGFNGYLEAIDSLIKYYESAKEIK